MYNMSAKQYYYNKMLVSYNLLRHKDDATCEFRKKIMMKQEVLYPFWISKHVRLYKSIYSCNTIGNIFHFPTKKQNKKLK